MQSLIEESLRIRLRHRARPALDRPKVTARRCLGRSRSARYRRSDGQGPGRRDVLMARPGRSRRRLTNPTVLRLVDILLEPRTCDAWAQLGVEGAVRVLPRA